jgi:hypothetical protein
LHFEKKEKNTNQAGDVVAASLAPSPAYMRAER